MDTQNELRKSWLKFVETFSNNLNTEEKIKIDNFNFEIKNYLGTGIILNNTYGFLTLDFSDRKCNWNVKDFISVTKITYESKRIGEMTRHSTNWSIEEFPCRIYGAENKGRIRFYRSDEISDFNELFNSFITVFESVIFAIIRLKIKSVLK